jgi:hypothetical protein
MDYIIIIVSVAVMRIFFGGAILIVDDFTREKRCLCCLVKLVCSFVYLPEKTLE